MSRRTAMAQELDALDQGVLQNNRPITLDEVLSGGGGGGPRPSTSAGGRSVQSNVSAKSSKNNKAQFYRLRPLQTINRKGAQLGVYQSRMQKPCPDRRQVSIPV